MYKKRVDLTAKTNSRLWSDEEFKALIKCHKKATVAEAVAAVNAVSKVERSEQTIINTAQRRGIRLLYPKKE